MDISRSEFETDLFEHPEKQPPELRRVTEKYGAVEDGDTYLACRDFLEEVEVLGFTFEYGLEGNPVGLREADDGEHDSHQTSAL